MKIAVTSANGKTICGHAGKCPGYLIYEINKNQTIRQTHIKLSRDQLLREFSYPISGYPDHPLAGINVFITQGLGDGLQARLESDNIKVIETKDIDPLLAVNRIELTRH
ncbi:NifB/NifX family molybdenum-iron cluster-binding protein [Thiomicrorhabdus indica]|uniref:NifB/NifX family molybdenum-iron cluster-binding protein n=1 Tax=Thiomicrorhabdus indica TaxID=2267253 RepID=UPI00102DA244|nr:nitrogen fixation protein [Thiomicrorhabdus indica]